ncbi:hypothetical protein PZH42_29440, partial [Bacteroides cellulosilyticus]
FHLPDSNYLRLTEILEYKFHFKGQTDIILHCQNARHKDRYSAHHLASIGLHSQQIAQQQDRYRIFWLVSLDAEIRYFPPAIR